MRISELIAELERLKEKWGDIDVKTQSLSHTWPPDIEVVERRGERPWLLLNS